MSRVDTNPLQMQFCVCVRDEMMLPGQERHSCVCHEIFCCPPSLLLLISNPDIHNTLKYQMRCPQHCCCPDCHISSRLKCSYVSSDVFASEQYSESSEKCVFHLLCKGLKQNAKVMLSGLQLQSAVLWAIPEGLRQLLLNSICCNGEYNSKR